ncbi:MAG: tetratricopeptide repeat protein [Planctomycetota bacterium]
MIARVLFSHPRAVVVVAAFVAYLTSLWGTFLYDDLHSVRDNPAIRSLDEIPRLLTDPAAFSAFDARMWRPVLLLSFALNHAMGGGHPLPFKLTDLAIHAATALALWSLARSLGLSRRRALLAGVLFAVHPLAAEAIGFVSARSDQLLALGAIVAMRAQVAVRRGSRGAWLGVLGGMVLACGSKETGVVVPGLLLIAHRLSPGRDGARARWRDTMLSVLPALGLAALYLLGRSYLLGAATVDLPAWRSSDGGRRDLLSQFAMMGAILPRFLAQSLVPIGLTPDPPIDGSSLSAGRVILGWVLVIGFTALGLAQWRRRPGIAVGVALTWAIALPWVLVPLNAPAGEHRFYGCLAGVGLAVVAALPKRALCGRAVLRTSTAILVLFAVQSARVSLDFRSAEALWGRALAVDPNSAAGYCGLSQAAREQANAAYHAGEVRRVVEHMRSAIAFGVRAISLRPELLTARRQLIEFRLSIEPNDGQVLLAVAEAQALVDLRPRNPEHRLLLARALIAAGQHLERRDLLELAETTALDCLTLPRPRDLVWRVAAAAAAAREDGAGAVAHLRAALARGFDRDPVRLDLADQLLALGDHAGAREQLAAVLRRAPFDARARELSARAAAPPR